MTGRGHGKVILLGEHAAVYGHAALAGAIDRGVTAVAEARAGALALRVDGTFALAVTAGDAHPVATALATIGARLGGDAMIQATATVPAGAGLGSSAALCVAIARALAARHRRAVSDDEVAAIANDAERSFHGTPSGLDAALAAAGGLGRFVRGVGLTRLAVPSVPLVIGLSGQPRSTATMVARVAEARAAAPAATDRTLARLGGLADEAADELARGDAGWSAVGAMLDEAHRLLADLGVSTARLDELVAGARTAGALGAKLTGGGGGGAVIALAPPAEADRVLTAWRALGADGFVATLGGMS